MRNLRDVADVELLRSVYYALCQSLLLYCITCWGSAAKTNLLQVERAQRSVLKVMFRKPYRFPTVDLYRLSGVLSVRQLFISRVSVAVHRSILASDDNTRITDRRVYRLPVPTCKTSFAFRFGTPMKHIIYNVVAKHCDIRNRPIFETKRLVNKWLLALSYNSTEDLLRVET